jgi:hypothetical protein
MLEKLIRYLKPLVLGLGIGAILVGLLVILRNATPPLEGTGAISWPDYWLSRYQTLLTGIAALVAAWVTIKVMRQQTETARADEAERALTRYAGAISEVMQKHENARPPGQHETLQAAEERLRALNDALDDATLRAATIDSVFGRDLPMLAMFVTCCRGSATDRVYGRDGRYTNMVWPLFIALTNGINRRKALLRGGAGVNSLYALSTIDQIEVGKAFVEKCAPNLV